MRERPGLWAILSSVWSTWRISTSWQVAVMIRKLDFGILRRQVETKRTVTLQSWRSASLRAKRIKTLKITSAATLMMSYLRTSLNSQSCNFMDIRRRCAKWRTARNTRFLWVVDLTSRFSSGTLTLTNTLLNWMATSIHLWAWIAFQASTIS